MKTQREIRQEMTAICHQMYAKNLITSTDGNISVRVGENKMLITPSGIHKGFIKLDDFVLTDLNGNLLQGTRRASQEISMHVGAYQSRPDIGAVIHAHPVHCIAFTMAGVSLGEDYLPEVILSVGKIPIVPYTTPTTDEVPAQIKSYLHNYNAMILDRHGSLTVGKSLQEAYNLLERIEHVAQTVFLARQLGPIKRLQPHELSKLQALLETSKAP